MLPAQLSRAPEGDGWLHEIKYDGCRTQLVIDRSGTRAFTRRGLDLSDRYAAVLSAAVALNSSSAVIDGEVIVQDEEGRSDFVALTSALHGGPERLVFMAFDLLYQHGRPAF